MTTATNYQLQAEIRRQQLLSNAINRAQSDISSTTRIQNPSDDPLSAARVAQIAQTQSNQATWTSNVKIATAVSDQADTVLTSVATQLQRANELILSAKNGTLNASDRASIADELNGIAQDIDSAALTKDSRGLPIFSTTTPLTIPISETVSIQAAPSKAEAFDQITTTKGVMSLGDIVRQAATAITGTDPVQRETDMSDALDGINTAIDHTSFMQGVEGTRAARIKSVTDNLATADTQLTEERSNIEDTDLTSTVAKMQSDMLSLQAAQATFVKINQQNLFTYLN
jgi:flagellar hook-associated protein 3 FlgL